jgi:hypothetical protein
MIAPPAEMALPNQIIVSVEDNNLRIQDINKQVLSFELPITKAIEWLSKNNYWQVGNTDIWEKSK